MGQSTCRPGHVGGKWGEGGYPNQVILPPFPHFRPGNGELEEGGGTLTKLPWSPTLLPSQLGLVQYDKNEGLWLVLPRNVNARLYFQMKIVRYFFLVPVNLISFPIACIAVFSCGKRLNLI